MKQESAKHVTPDGSSSEPEPIDAEPGHSNEAEAAAPPTDSPTLTASNDVAGPVQTEQACGATTEGARAGVTCQVDEIDRARAQEYSLLSALLAHSPDAQMIEHLAGLSGDATPLGVAHGALSAAAAHVSPERIEREYFDLFVGSGHGELFPYASYYLTGFLYGRPLARLRETLQQNWP
jgi:hypothetical protein